MRISSIHRVRAIFSAFLYNSEYNVNLVDMKKVAITVAVYALPLVALAQTFGGGELQGYLQSVVNFVNSVIIPLIIAFAILVFIWGMVQYFILGASDAEKRESGKSLIIWGLVGFVLILSIQGIINLLAGAFGFSNERVNNLPELPFSGGRGR